MTNTPNASTKKKKNTGNFKISVTLPERIGKSKYPKKTPPIPLTEEGYEIISFEAADRGYDLTPFLTQILENLAKDIKKMRAEQADGDEFEEDNETDLSPSKITRQAEI